MLAGIRPDHEFESIVDYDSPVGEGMQRKVYRVSGDEHIVIKRSKVPFHTDNMTEWMVWQALIKMGEDIMGNDPNTEIRNVFARCLAISHSGQFLMMERLWPLTSIPSDFSKRLPSWLNDKKPSAFGTDIDGLPKVADYADIKLYQALNPKNSFTI